MAGDLKAQLEITADASGVEAGVGRAQKSLKSLGITAATEGKKAAEGIERIGDGGDVAAAKVDRSTKSLINSIQRVTAAQQAGGQASSDYFRTLAAQRGIDTGPLKPYLDQLDAVRARQSEANAALQKGGVEFNKYGVSVKQNAAALRQVPAQLTDIIVGLQGGQAPLTVLLQQGGQLRDVFGGVVPAAKALGGAVLGLVNPYTLAASAVAALGLAYFQGSKEADAFNKSIVLSGNASGVTVNNLTAMAQRIDAVTGTQASAAAALAEFVSAGVAGAENLERFTTTALRMESITGQAVKETAKQFAELGKSPVDAAVKLNESTNFLTNSLYQQIRALEEQGRTAEAAAVAQKGYADALDQRLVQVESQLGTLERAWKGIVSSAKEGWDAMLGIGRQDTLEQQLSKVNDQIKAASGQDKNRPFRMPWEESLDSLKARQASLQELQRLQSRAAASEAASAAQVKARVAFDKEGEQFLNNRAKMEKAITEARNQGLAAGASQEEIDKRVLAIREKYADKGAAKTAVQIDKAELARDLSAFKSASDQLIGTYAQSERIIESIRAAGLMSDREYYEAKRGFINLESDAKERALKQEIDRLGQEKLKDDKKIDNDRKIAEATAKMLMVRADASSQLEVLANQEAAAQTRVELAFLSARQAAQDYYDTVQRQQERMLAGIGRGNQQRRRDAGINQIEDRYANQRRELENQKSQLEFEGKFTDEARTQYARRLALINEFQAKSIASYVDYYQKLIDTQANWSLGAEEALRNYFDDSKNRFSQAAEFVTRSFQGMEDALAKFAATGKLDFKSLADSIIADLARIAVKQTITGPLANALMGAFGGGKTTGAGAGIKWDAAYSPVTAQAANGGVFAGPGIGAYSGTVVSKPTVFPFAKGAGLMGEAGHEAILPLRRGTDGKLGVEAAGGGGAVTVNVINQSGLQLQGTAQQRQGPDDQRIVDLVLTVVGDSLANRSGPAARGLENGYGLRPALG